MTQTSLDKSKIRILLLEGVHQSALETFQKAGYTNIESVVGSLPEDELLEKIKDVHFVGIRSRTQLTEEVFDAAERLVAVGCFCIGTNIECFVPLQNHGQRMLHLDGLHCLAVHLERAGAGTTEAA